jgi:flavorubredoxin
MHFGEGLNLETIESGQKINIGKNNLTFVPIPMVHWPDSMVTYLGEEKLLFSNDAFGQHIASTERFDDELHWGIIEEEAAKYYANIVLPFGRQVNKALDVVTSLDIDMVAPSHGIIWRNHVADAVKLYKKWANNECKDKALIVYDTMWKSTKKMAYAIEKAFEEKNIVTKMTNIECTDISDIMTDLLESKYIIVGSPTLNNNMLPTVAGFLTYMKGLAPKGRIGMAFGSYGWGGQSVDQVNEILSACGFEVLEKIKHQFVPDEGALDAITEKVKEAIS